MNIRHVPFSEIAEQVITTAHTQVWCAVATVDTQGRPRTRVLHPIWEPHADSLRGWICTDRTSLKDQHISRTPYASLCYDRDIVKPVIFDCHAEWSDDLGDKQRIWDWFKREPAPLGYDPGIIWKTVDNPVLGLLKLTPYRITVGQLGGEWRLWAAE